MQQHPPYPPSLLRCWLLHPLAAALQHLPWQHQTWQPLPLQLHPLLHPLLHSLLQHSPPRLTWPSRPESWRSA